jgi:hypothetical protein
MVSFLAHNRQCTLVLTVVVFMLLVGLLSSPHPALAQSAVTLDPTEGAPGTEVTATGSSWSAGHQVSVQWDDGTELTTTTVDDSGGFTVSFTVPDDAADGQHTVYFVDAPPDGGSGYFIPSTFTVTAPSETPPPEADSAITLDPTEGPPGTTVTIQGSGWTPGETVILWFAVNLEADGSYTEHTIWYDIGQATVGDDGSFTATFTVPAEATDSGTQGVSVDTSEASHQAVAFFQVVTDPAETPPPDGEGEPDLTANAGPDQTVPGPSPVTVQLDGSGSTGEIVRYLWYNQYGLLRAEGATPVIEVNFGYKDPQPGTQRTFTLVVEDSQGNTAQDEVSITLEETPPPEDEGETDLVANAGHDQTVPGSSPVAVQFDGSGSTGDIVRYQWYNQWGLLRAEGVAPLIDVNFGYNDPQPGTKRTFTLVVEDSQGNTAQDEVTITLGETEESDGEGEADLTANAGPDQTVPGPSPVAVQFDGSGSTGDIVRYQWYNQSPSQAPLGRSPWWLRTPRETLRRMK